MDTLGKCHMVFFLLPILAGESPLIFLHESSRREQISTQAKLQHSKAQAQRRVYASSKRLNWAMLYIGLVFADLLCLPVLGES